MMENLLFETDMYLKQKRYPLVNSLLAVHNGETMLERYYNGFTPESRNNLKSVWKSILAVTTGICLDKGYIKSLDDPIGAYLPVFAGEKHILHPLITIRHLLTMTSGIYWNGGVHYHCPMMAQMRSTNNWTAFLSDIAMADRPGTRFVYKEWDVMLLSAVIGAAAGRSAYEVCAEYFYGPLGIQSGRWGQSPDGFDYTVIEDVEAQSNLSARDMAAIGELFLHNGCRQGRRIVSEAFLREAVTPSASYAGYGYLLWLCDGYYAARGFGGQEIKVYPAHNIVIVIQATATNRSKSYNDVSDWLAAKLIN